MPAIISYPAQTLNKAVSSDFASVKDLLPTFLDLAGAQHPITTSNGQDVLPLQGASLWPGLAGMDDRFHDPDYYMGWEFQGTGAVIQGDWKLLLEKPPFGENTLQLYNLTEDPGETLDRSLTDPEIFAKMKQLWAKYKAENGVLDYQQ